MEDVITGKIIELIELNKDLCYEFVDDILIAYNNIHQYQKINLNYEKILVDEFIYNTNVKKTKIQNYYNSKELLINNRKFYFLTIKVNEIINSIEIFEEKLEEIKITKRKPSLLLHSCCGPCSSYVLDYLKDYFDITILYYNPNIDTLEEFSLRLDNLKKITDIIKSDVKIIVPEYNHQNYLDYIKGNENYKEGEKRCYLCYQERMDFLARFAKDKYDYFTTTLSISPYKNADWINEIGIKLQEKYNVKYLYANFKLHDGYKKSIELSKKYNLYRQDYCGCEFSKRKA